jgi:two-component system, NtrC family, response regulator AtoC
MQELTGQKRILIVEDETPLRQLLHKRLSRKGGAVDSFGSAEEALSGLGRTAYDVALIDIRLPGMDGLDLLKTIKKSPANTEVIIITGHGTIDSAIAAMKLGAYDYLTKPCKLSELEILVQRAYEKKALHEANLNLKEELRLTRNYDEIITKSRKMLEVLSVVDKVATSTSNILIEGETGTGKELVAHAIHRNSLRRNKSFIVIHCAALPETLQESELFGYEKGAFTGAVKQKKGLVELADGGTLLIDEIGEITPLLQVKLLRFIETGWFRRLGGDREIQISVRVIAATNRDLHKLVKAGLFREDLYYRLNVVNLHLPPLRERKGDVALLADYFLKKTGSKKRLTRHAVEALTVHDWPGNVRELANAIETASLTCSKSLIDAEDLPLPASPAHPGKVMTLAELEKEHIRQALASSGGNKTKASGILGISLRNLYRKIERYGIS